MAAGAVILRWALALGIGGLFLYAGALKCWDTQEFALDVQNFQLTSWDHSILIAVYLPWVEICAGAALILRRGRLGALAILTGLMLVFTAALGSAWWRGLDITCGCFGREESATDFPVLLTRDAAILAALAVLAWLEVRASRALTKSAGEATEPAP